MKEPNGNQLRSIFEVSTSGPVLHVPTGPGGQPGTAAFMARPGGTGLKISAQNMRQHGNRLKICVHVLAHPSQMGVFEFEFLAEIILEQMLMSTGA